MFTAAPGSVATLREALGNPEGTGHIDCGDGELRAGVGCYSVLPPSFLAGRRGVTVLKIVVRGDGTIARTEVAHHSGYGDIDSKVEQMIAAVRRFPPLRLDAGNRPRRVRLGTGRDETGLRACRARDRAPRGE